jgi:hypothetical protein
MTIQMRSAAVAALAVLALAAGCGGDDGGDGGDAGDSDFAKQSGNEIADAAKAAMKDLDQVKYSGEIASTESDIQLDIQASSTGDCTGSIVLGEGTAEVLSKDGASWFKPDEAFWRSNAGEQADAVITAVGDKWVLDSDGEFAQFCDLDEFFEGIFSDDEGSDSDYKTVGTDEVDGKDVVKVDKPDDDGSSAVGYVLIEGEHYLVKLEKQGGDEPGTLEFSEFNEKFEVEAPAEDDVVDLSQL